MKTKLDPHLIARTDGRADPNQICISGKIRITVIAPEMIRVEFDERKKFLDKATQAVWFRNCGSCTYQVEHQDRMLVVRTEKAVFHINTKKARIEYVELEGERIPADNRDNLKGTHRTLDRARGAVTLEKGVISPSGVAVMEDKTLILDEDGQCKPRAGEKDLYCFASKDHQRVLHLYYQITGAPPMVPRYALGNWWSRYHAYTQQEYLDLMDTFIEKDIPFTVATIDMDWHWVDVKGKFGYKRELDMYPFFLGWTGYSWNTDLFPDYRAMLRQLKEKDLHITVNLHPASGVRAFEDQYEDMCRAMGREPDGKVIRFDCTDPNFLNAYFKVLHKPYEEDGVDFWWIDWQQGSWSKMPGLDPLWVCNHYHTLDLAKNGKRPLILSRYAGIGSHRYPLGFSGDACILWSALDFQPYFTSNAANVGYTHWSHDLGGHYLGKPGDDELYLRWLQFGVFTPIMRLHSSNSTLSKEPWNHKAVEEEAVAALRLRHSLIPYIYTAYYHNHKNSVPVCRPLYYDWPQVKEAYEVKNQYMFGPSLMVCPITAPGDQAGISTREIWLPEGVWTDIFTGEALTGGRHVVTRDRKSIPVFARAGAIIPVQDVKGNFTGNPDHLILHVYHGDGTYTLYEDDGESTDYLEGRGAHTKFRLRGNVFTIDPAEGEPSCMHPIRSYTVSFKAGFNRAEVYVNGNRAFCEISEKNVTIQGIRPEDRVEIRLE